MRRRRLFFSSGLRRLFNKKKLLIFFLILLLFGGGFVFLLHQFANHRLSEIKMVAISGNRQSSLPVMADLIQTVLEGERSITKWPNNIWWWPPKRELKKELSNKYFNLNDIKIGVRPWRRELVIEVKEDNPTMVKCAGNWENRQNCYFINKSGYNLKSAPIYSSGVVFHFLAGSGTEPEPAVFADLQIMAQKLPVVLTEAGLGDFWLLGAEYLSEKDFAFILAPQQTVNWSEWKLYLNIDRSLTNLAADIKTVMQVPEFQTGLKEAGGLEYLDFRFGNRVFYKFLDQE